MARYGPGSVNSQLPEGHHPAKPDSLRPCRARRRFFAFSKESRRSVAGGQRPVSSAVDAGRATGRWTQRSCVHIYRYRRAGGSGAIDKTRSSETWETWELSRQDSLERDLGDLGAIETRLARARRGRLGRSRCLPTGLLPAFISSRTPTGCSHGEPRTATRRT